jgi:GNAT superfamily N-acetyltransferase
MNSQIRAATPTDLPALCRLMSLLAGHPVSRETMLDRLKFIETSPIDELFVIEAEGAVKGLLGFRIRENLEEDSRYGEISAIVTDPDSRGQGLGKALMAFAEGRARELDCIGTWLVSGFGEEMQAHAFYQGMGYQVTGYRFVKR